MKVLLYCSFISDVIKYIISLHTNVSLYFIASLSVLFNICIKLWVISYIFPIYYIYNMHGNEKVKIFKLILNKFVIIDNMFILYGVNLSL